MTKKEKKEERMEPTYISRDGFVNVKVLRGYTELEAVHDLVVKFGGIICGGYVRWMCSTAEAPVLPGDLDIYFENDRDFEEASRKIMLYLPVKHENEISRTFLRARSGPFVGAPDIQLIKPVSEGKVETNGDMQKVLENFDFTVVRAGLNSSRGAFVDADFAHDEAKKILRLKNIHCPVGSTLRCMKYSKKGYWLPPTQALRLFFDWDMRSDEYKAELIRFVTMANNGTGLTQKEIDEMEKMMRID